MGGSEADLEREVPRVFGGGRTGTTPAHTWRQQEANENTAFWNVSKNIYFVTQNYISVQLYYYNHVRIGDKI